MSDVTRADIEASRKVILEVMDRGFEEMRRVLATVYQEQLRTNGSVQKAREDIARHDERLDGLDERVAKHDGKMDRMGRIVYTGRWSDGRVEQDQAVSDDRKAITRREVTIAVGSTTLGVGAVLGALKLFGVIP